MTPSPSDADIISGCPLYGASLLQKNSPYIDDVNELLGLAKQSGLLNALGGTFDSAAMPNVTKCGTWQDIHDSHMALGENVVIDLEDTYGIMFLLMVGLGGALFVFFAEFAAHNADGKRKRTVRSRIGWT